VNPFHVTILLPQTVPQVILSANQSALLSKKSVVLGHQALVTTTCVFTNPLFNVSGMVFLFTLGLLTGHKLK
jgi:hypothetical protein